MLFYNIAKPLSVSGTTDTTTSTRFFSLLPTLSGDNNRHTTQEDVMNSQLFTCIFVFPTGGSKEEQCGWICCERPFLYVNHTIVCLSLEARPSGRAGWQGKSLRTCSPAHNSGIAWRLEVTHTLTFNVFSAWLLRRLDESDCIELNVNQRYFQRCHYCNLIPLRASWWLKTRRPSVAATRKEQYVFIGIRCVYGRSTWLCALSHASLSQIAFPHTALSRWIRLQNEITTKAIVLFAFNKEYYAPLCWLRSFSSVWETQSRIK